MDWAEGLVSLPGKQLEEWRSRTWETVLKFVRKERDQKPIQFFLSYLYPRQIDVGAIAELQRIGVPCVNFFCDNVREFHKMPVEYRPFSLHWVPEFEALPLYRNAGLPHLHMPMPCWVPIELRCVPAAETEAPTFIGSADILRRDLLGRAVRAGADLVIRGTGWTPTSDSLNSEVPTRRLGAILRNQMAFVRTHGLAGFCRKIENHFIHLDPPTISENTLMPQVSRDEYVRITREAIVAIGINRVPATRVSNRHPLTYSRLRDIEAPMLGACYLTEWTAGLGELYELGKEIESYRTPEELQFKIDELKKDGPRRKIMRQRAQRRALADHTAVRSLIRIGERLGAKSA
ncbi:MAG: glycosyltransferase family 1 protein [Burkholderiales bacterium]|nr:glycosyltransferase family 1 protein [Burkholderiales bacterium]